MTHLVNGQNIFSIFYLLVDPRSKSMIRIRRGKENVVCFLAKDTVCRECRALETLERNEGIEGIEGIERIEGTEGTELVEPVLPMFSPCDALFLCKVTRKMSSQAPVSPN